MKRKKRIKPEKKTGIEDLIVLRQGGDGVIGAVDVDTATNENDTGVDFSVDLKRGIWCWDDKTYQIGRGRVLEAKQEGFCPNAVIGVYDRTITDHLDQMVNDATEVDNSA